MLKRIINILLIILFSTISLNISSTYKDNIINQIITSNPSKNEYARLIIEKININKELYNIDSKENTVDKNITILKESTTPDNNESLMIIAAHSGNGFVAYFNRLNELDINDEIILIYKSKKYYYEVTDIFEQKKNGYINVNKDNKKQLILTTCSPTKDNIQLIVNCTEKESN